MEFTFWDWFIVQDGWLLIAMFAIVVLMILTKMSYHNTYEITVFCMRCNRTSYIRLSIDEDFGDSKRQCPKCKSTRITHV